MKPNGKPGKLRGVLCGYSVVTGGENEKELEMKLRLKRALNATPWNLTASCNKLYTPLNGRARPTQAVQ